MRINNHTIKLKEDKKSLYCPIYSLKLVELKILKIEIKTNLANSFINFLQISDQVFIFFDWKSNSSFCFC